MVISFDQVINRERKDECIRDEFYVGVIISDIVVPWIFDISGNRNSFKERIQWFQRTSDFGHQLFNVAGLQRQLLRQKIFCR